ncbi:MAG TPA: DUF4190 domain-containing protein [Candidatus Hydrogenedentes bacterium]|nr:DUF4190 domain-containing protein [Candidatus Hydrogenedentota bacterium]
MSNWYYLVDEEQHGPVGEEDIQQMMASGELRPDDLLWQAGMSDWIEVREAFPTQARVPGITGLPGGLEAVEPAPGAGGQAAGSAPPGSPAPVFMPVTERGMRQMPSAPSVMPAAGQIHPLALASIILAIASPFFCGLLALPAIVLGHMALSRIRRDPERYGGYPLAVAALVVGYAVVVLTVLLLLLTVLSMAG